LDPFDTPEPKDLQALMALHEAQTAFGTRLADCFSDALTELENIGYPGVTDPKLTITTNIRPIDGLNHPSAVQYEVPTHVTGSLAHIAFPKIRTDLVTKISSPSSSHSWHFVITG
jgi:hypothetical protein